MRTILFQPQRNLDFNLSGGKVDTRAASGPKGSGTAEDLEDPDEDDDDLGDGDKNKGGQNGGETEEQKQARLKKEQEDKAEQEKIAARAKELGGDSFDNKGNLLDDKGTVVKTKEELDKTNEDEDDSIIGSFQKKYGVATDVEYTEDTEGLGKLIDEQIIPNAKKEAVIEVFKEYPVLADFYRHVFEKGHSIDSFKQKHQMIDFTKVEIKDDDVAQQEKYYRASLKIQGMEDEEIEEAISTAKDKNKLGERAKAALKKLDNYQKQEYQRNIDEEAAELQRQQEYEETVTKEVNTILEKGVLMGYELPKPILQKLNDYIYNPVDNKGYTARDKRQFTTEQMLWIDLMDANGWDLSGVNLKKVGKSKDLTSLKKKNDERQHIDTTNQNSNSGGGASGGLSSILASLDKKGD